MYITFLCIDKNLRTKKFLQRTKLISFNYGGLRRKCTDITDKR